MIRLRIPADLQVWIDARKRHHLSHATVQMARELGMNPKKLGKLDNARQEPWKAPLPELIANLYFRRFGREKPDPVLTIEEIARRQQEKKDRKRAEKIARRSGEVMPVASGRDVHERDEPANAELREGAGETGVRPGG